jgi:hypothetical protein
MSALPSRLPNSKLGESEALLLQVLHTKLFENCGHVPVLELN